MVILSDWDWYTKQAMKSFTMWKQNYSLWYTECDTPYYNYALKQIEMKILLMHLDWPFFADLDQQWKTFMDSCLCAKQNYIKREKKNKVSNDKK